MEQDEYFVGFTKSVMKAPGLPDVSEYAWLKAKEFSKDFGFSPTNMAATIAVAQAIDQERLGSWDLAIRLLKYRKNPHDINPMSESFNALLSELIDHLSGETNGNQ